MKPKTLLLAFSLALAAAAPAAAQNVQAENPQAIVDLLQEWGYRAELTKDTQGDPLIESSTAGVRFQIYFYGCSLGSKCNAIQFSSGFDLDAGTTLDIVNTWNTTKRFGKVYLDDEKDPFIEVDLNLYGGGISRENFRDTLQIWETLLGEFQTHINW